jgi:hypothetical protein
MVDENGDHPEPLPARIQRLAPGVPQADNLVALNQDEATFLALGE